MDHIHHIFQGTFVKTAALDPFSGLVCAKKSMCTNDAFSGPHRKWQDPLGGILENARNARTNISSTILCFQHDIRCPRIQNMFKVILDISEQNQWLLSLFHSTVLMLSRIVSCGWQDVSKANLFSCTMMKDKENLSEVFLLDHILSHSIFAHGSDQTYTLVDHGKSWHWRSYWFADCKKKKNGN